MQSRAGTVGEYLQTVPAPRKAALMRLRRLCRKTLDACTENMAYGMPSYVDPRTGVVTVAFNSQKHYIALYLNPAIVAAHRIELAGLSCGKSCIRFTRPERIDFAVIESMLRDAASGATR